MAAAAAAVCSSFQSISSDDNNLFYAVSLNMIRYEITDIKHRWLGNIHWFQKTRPISSNFNKY